jgi:hypothetical protein
VVSRKSVRQIRSRVPLIGRYNHFEHLLLFFILPLRATYNTTLSLNVEYHLNLFLCV